MNYLVDTNLFLEILLNQGERKKCEVFSLASHKGQKSCLIPRFSEGIGGGDSEPR
jgi:hypothetical protein